MGKYATTMARLRTRRGKTAKHVEIRDWKLSVSNSLSSSDRFIDWFKFSSDSSANFSLTRSNSEIFVSASMSATSRSDRSTRGSARFPT